MPLWDTGVQYGNRAGQPTPNAKQSGTLYFVSDEDVLERWSGSAWQQVAINAAASLDTGASFPGSPTTSDRYRRSDLAYAILVYDGTR